MSKLTHYSLCSARRVLLEVDQRVQTAVTWMLGRQTS